MIPERGFRSPWCQGKLLILVPGYSNRKQGEGAKAQKVW